MGVPDLEQDNADVESDDDVALAVARLEWAKEARCLDIPEQATALLWHAEACDEARHAVDAADGVRE